MDTNRAGIIAFAFGQHGASSPEKPEPSNDAIAEVAQRVHSRESKHWQADGMSTAPLIATQWEVDQRKSLCQHADLVVSQRGTDTDYVDTKFVLDKSLEYFKQRGIKRIILIAHPLHLVVIKLMIKFGGWKIDGFTIDSQYDKFMQAIPYDTSDGNSQSWTRGPFVFVAYLVKALVTSKHGS